MIVISGAGIAGLTFANYLEQAHIDYLVIEKAAQLKAIGAGIIVQNNGLAILNDLGITELNGQCLTAMNLGYNGFIRRATMANTGLQAVCLHRAELQRALLGNIPLAKIKLNCKVQHCTPHATGVKLTLSDATIVNADYLINAAGLQTHLHDQSQLIDSGQVCWRTIIATRKALTEFGEYWFGQQRIGIGPVNSQQAYLFHVINQRRAEQDIRFSDQARVRWLTAQTATIPAMQYLDFATTKWLCHPLVERKINWGNGRIIAIGDAAHAMTPNLGQGAVLAMEDAATLANLLKQKTAEPLKRLIKLRHRRVRAVQKASWQMGKFAHNEQLIMPVMKNILFKTLPMTWALKTQVRWMNQFIKTL